MSKLLCPLMAFHIGNRLGGDVECLNEECALASDIAGECLIRQALELYVSKERTKIAEEKEMAETYWATKKDGTRQLLVFPSATKDVLVDSRISDNEAPEFRPPRQQSESPTNYHTGEKIILHDRSYCDS